MSIKADLRALVQVQQRELELERIGGEITTIETERSALQAQIADAEAVVKKAEKDVEDARAEAKRLDLDLKSAEENVQKFKDQMHNVKTNEQLWAIQEEIGHAEGAVGDVETKILEQLEVADSLTGVIEEKKTELAKEKQRIDGEVAKANKAEAGLVAERDKVETSMAELREQVPADLMKKFEGIKSLRAGIGVAEIYEELCMVCNTTVRPQLAVDAHNLEEIIRCENCKRIVYIAERLDLPSEAAALQAAEADAKAAAAASDSAPADDMPADVPTPAPEAEAAPSADVAS